MSRFPTEAPIAPKPRQLSLFTLIVTGIEAVGAVWAFSSIRRYWIVVESGPWPGAVLACLLIGVLILFLVGRQVYLVFIGSQTIVEINAEPVQPGQEVALYVEHTSGRIPTQKAEIQLVCEQITRETRGVGSKRTHNYKKSFIYQDSLGHFSAAQQITLPWQQNLTMMIPPDALPTTPPEAYPTIEWMIAFKLKLANAPDIRMTFPFRVVVEEYEASDANEPI